MIDLISKKSISLKVLDSTLDHLFTFEYNASV